MGLCPYIFHVHRERKWTLQFTTKQLLKQDDHFQFSHGKEKAIQSYHSYCSRCQTAHSIHKCQITIIKGSRWPRNFGNITNLPTKPTSKQFILFDFLQDAAPLHFFDFGFRVFGDRSWSGQLYCCWARSSQAGDRECWWQHSWLGYFDAGDVSLLLWSPCLRAWYPC